MGLIKLFMEMSANKAYNTDMVRRAHEMPIGPTTLVQIEIAQPICVKTVRFAFASLSDLI